MFLPGESRGRGSLVAAVYGVTQSRTRLKRLSSKGTLCNFVGVSHSHNKKGITGQGSGIKEIQQSVSVMQTKNCPCQR